MWDVQNSFILLYSLLYVFLQEKHSPVLGYCTLREANKYGKGTSSDSLQCFCGPCNKL